MRILIYGDCEDPGSGGWCYVESLRDLGHHVITCRHDDGLELYKANVPARVWRKVTRGVLEHHRRRHVSRLLDRASEVRPECAFVFKGLYLGPDDVVALKSKASWVANINHDDFFSRNRSNWSARQRAALPHYDYIFTTREINVEELRPVNPRVEFFPFAYYPRIHRPVAILPEERDEWEADVVFVGTWERERCSKLEALVQRVRGKYAIWGAQWDKVKRHSPLRAFTRGREVVMDEMAKAIGGAKVALAFLRKENRDDYTQRTFEIPACGGVLLAERTPRHLELFREGEEAEFFDHDSPDELVAKVQMLLREDGHREKLRAAGREAVLSQPHTYQDRMQRVLELFHKNHRTIH